MASTASVGSSDVLLNYAGQLFTISAHCRVALLRSRRMGSISYIDIVVDVPGDIVVEQAHKLARQVQATTDTVLGRSVETHVRFQAEPAK